jgi:3',5'-cyclic AMP phosphodiesterase CpdA
MFVLAHMSDPHLGPVPPPRFSELASKRLLGFVNWQRSRRFLHRSDVLAGLVADLKAQAPGHIAVTGDLVNIALPGEFLAARAWLERLGPPGDVTLVPGNHDAYVRAARDAPTRYWGDYMRGEERGGAPVSGPPTFPFVRRRGPVALIGLSTALPTSPFLATGRLGIEQTRRLGDILAALGQEGCFRAVLIHHPPASRPPGAPRARAWKRLVDAELLRGAVARHGAELILHGHDHVHALAWLDGPNGRIPAVGVPSASAAHTSHDGPAAYNLYRIDGAAGSWRCEMVSRGLSANGDLMETGRRRLIGTGAT